MAIVNGLLQIQINDAEIGVIQTQVNDEFTPTQLLIGAFKNVCYPTGNWENTSEIGGYVDLGHPARYWLGYLDSLNPDNTNVVFRGFKREALKSFIRNELPPLIGVWDLNLDTWQSTIDTGTNHEILEFISSEYMRLDALDKPDDYLDTITFIKSESGDYADNIIQNMKQYSSDLLVDLFDELATYVPNHIASYDNDGLYLCQTAPNKITFRTAGIIKQLMSA